MDQFLEKNVGWIITLVGMVISTAISWTRTTEKVNNLNERLDKQDHMLEEIKTTGSPSSRTAIMVLNSRVEGQSSRLAELEKIAATVAGMATDIQWIKREMLRGNKNE